jgi:hypothetical protein
MSTISLRLPESLHVAIRKAAKKDHISINQLMSLAAAEKISALLTEDYLTSRAQSAPSRHEYKKILLKAPKVNPHPDDQF